MDHRGPEHHFDEIECPGCGKFFEFGKGKPTSNNTCSNCGFDMRPYRGQTNKELQPEIYERNTPLDGNSEDRGGNPTQTGILAPTTSSFDPLEHIELEEKDDNGEICPICNVSKLEEVHGTNGPHYRCKGCNSRFRSEEIHPDSSAVDPKGLGETDPYTDRMPEDLDPETQKGWRTVDTNPVKRDEWTASVKESNDIPVEHIDLEWVIVDIAEPDSEITEAQEKFTIYVPNGITDSLDEALKQLNVWVENPEENGKLRPYREYSDVIRPKINSGEIQIGVEDPHMADIINHVARTNDLSPIKKTSGPAVPAAAGAAAIPEVIGLGALEAAPLVAEVAPGAGAALAEGGAAATGFAGDLMSGIINLTKGGADKLAGGIGGMLKGIPGFSKKYMQLKGAESILDPALGIGGNDGGDSSAALQSGLVDLSSPEFAPTTASTYVGTYGDELETPDSVSKRVDTEDPEHVDPHELNDGDNDNINKYDPSNNGMGQGRSPRGQDKTQPDISTSPAMERFLMTLPLIMHYYHSGESVENDPMIEALHNALENEFPGYLEDEIPDDENPLIEFVKNNKSMPKEAAAAPMTMMPQTPHNKPMEIPAEVPSNQGKDMRGHTTQTCNIADCPQCREMGAPANDPQRGGIPSTQVSLTQPGVYNPSTMPPIPPPQQQQQKKQGSDHQGPHTKEQVIAVGELLEEQGRGEEILDMIKNPNEFAEEMAQIQGVQSPAEDVSFDAQTAAPPMPAQTAPPANQGMPVPAPKAPGQAAGGGGGMQMGASMLKAAYRYGADSIASKCPKCDSHSTKMINQDGKCKCHTCGHTWKDKHFEKSDGGSTDTSTTSHVYANETLSWKDTNDQPLVENERYMMNRSTGDAIGDEIRIKSITPNDITIILNENSSRAIEETLPLEEIHLDGLTFSPVNGEFGDNNPGIEENADGKPLPEAGSDHTDLSTPHREVGASTKTAGKHYTPMEQRELIDEVGEARNADKLNLEGTHYAEADEDYFLFGC